MQEHFFNDIVQWQNEDKKLSEFPDWPTVDPFWFIQADVLCVLSHKHIIQFYGAVTQKPNFCLITEYAKFGSLHDYIGQNKLDFYQILNWSKQIALGECFFYFNLIINFGLQMTFSVTENPSNEGFVFSNYQNLNNGNLLLESGQILKQKWHKTTKNCMLKLTYIKALWKYLSSIANFQALKSKNLNLTICFGSWIIQFKIQEIVFKFFTQQSTGRKSQRDKQLKFAPQLNKFA